MKKNKELNTEDSSVVAQGDGNQLKLLKEVIGRYDTARRLLSRKSGKTKVIRKKNHGLGSYLEDTVAVFMAKVIDYPEIQLWVDQTFKKTTEGDKKDFNPDITVIKKGKVIGFVEVKDSANPFRWKATSDQNKGLDYMESRKTLFDSISGSLISYKVKGIVQRQVLPVSESPFFYLALFSDQLFPKKKMKRLKEYAGKDNVELFIFMKGYHPNSQNQPYSANKLMADAKIHKGLYNFKEVVRQIND
jgi:hypothetical protein